MKCIKNILFIVGLLVMNSLSAKSLKTVPAIVPGVVPPKEEFMTPPDISTLPAPLNAPERLQPTKKPITKRGEKKSGKAVPETRSKLGMEDYARKQVAAYQTTLINDIFPKKSTIERIVNDFKAEYPGPNKEADSTILYNAIVNNPEIKKTLTLGNAVNAYRFIRETISKAWDAPR